MNKILEQWAKERNYRLEEMKCINSSINETWFVKIRKAYIEMKDIELLNTMFKDSDEWYMVRVKEIAPIGMSEFTIVLR